MSALALWYAAQRPTAELVGLNILLALSLVAMRSAGLLSLANAAFMGVGAYTAALLTLDAGWPFWAVLPAGAAAAAVVALLLALPALRLGPLGLAVITIAFGQVAPLIALALPATGALGLAGVPERTAWWEIAVALLLASYLLWQVRRSRLGHAFAAIRRDERLAAGLGIAVALHRLLAFLMGAGLAGLAGGLAAHTGAPLAPADFGLPRAFAILAYAVLGGDAAWAAWPAAALLTLLPLWLGAANGPAADPAATPLGLVVLGLITLLVVVAFPGGLSGLRPRRPATPPADAAPAGLAP